MNVDRITAVHEAGHSVIAAQFGFEIAHVVVHPPGAHADELGHCKVASWRADLNRDPHRAVVYLLCGGAAETQLTGRTSPRDASDRALAAGVAATIYESDDDDDPRARTRGARGGAGQGADV